MRIFAVNKEMRRVMNVRLLARVQVTCPEGHAPSATWNMLCAVDRLRARGSSQRRCEQVLANSRGVNRCAGASNSTVRFHSDRLSCVRASIIDELSSIKRVNLDASV